LEDTSRLEGAKLKLFVFSVTCTIMTLKDSAVLPEQAMIHNVTEGHTEQEDDL